MRAPRRRRRRRTKLSERRSKCEWGRISSIVIWHRHILRLTDIYVVHMYTNITRRPTHNSTANSLWKQTVCPKKETEMDSIRMFLLCVHVKIAICLFSSMRSKCIQQANDDISSLFCVFLALLLSWGNHKRLHTLCFQRKISGRTEETMAHRSKGNGGKYCVNRFPWNGFNFNCHEHKCCTTNFVFSVFNWSNFPFGPIGKFSSTYFIFNVCSVGRMKQNARVLLFEFQWAKCS